MKTSRAISSLLALGLVAGSPAVAQEGTPVASKHIRLSMGTHGYYCHELGSFFRPFDRLEKQCPMPRGVRLRFDIQVSSKHPHSHPQSLPHAQHLHYLETGELPEGYPIVIFTRQWIESISCTLQSEKGVRTPLDWRPYLRWEVHDRYRFPLGGPGNEDSPGFDVIVPGELTEKLDLGFYDLDCSATWTDGGIVTGHTGFWVCNRDTPFARALWARDQADGEQLPAKQLEWYLKAIEEDPETPGPYEHAAEIAEHSLKRYDLAADLLERYLEKLRKKVEQVAPGYEPRPSMGPHYPAFDPKARLAEVEQHTQARIARLRSKKGG
ncbi:MAG: hypothetical protein HYV63_12910 [Candidatus Schekmanbacteria bacterium]|nr:hypothetical protein [Candidatus Schekmanbacteria bacterium]